MYQIARELGRPHRAVLQLLRELGYQVASHMVGLAPEEEASLREAVERQQRGAPAVRAVHTTAQSVEASQVAEVVHGVDLEEEPGAAAAAAAAPGAVAAAGTATVGAAAGGATAAPGTVRPRQAAPLRPETRPGTAPKPGDRTTPIVKKKAPVPGPKRPGRAIEQVLEDFDAEAVKEQIEMVADVTATAAPATPAAAPLEPGQLLRTVDLSAVEEEPVPPPQARRRAVVNVGGRQIRTLQRKRQKGPRVSLQASQTLHIETPISLNDFSQTIGVGVNDLLKRLIAETKQLTWNKNSVLDEARVRFLAAAFQRDVVIGAEKTAEDLLEEQTLEHEVAAEGEQEPRPPVVAILGHVDHGKTSLLDKIRNTNVVAKEHGGITQHIGAFQVETSGGKRVTFLDTPGHAAFTSMRARGAQVADIVVLVVAADDGVMPQTEEAINHARVAGTPIVVAINKIDKPAANATKVMQQLSAHGLTPEEWGGETICCPVSALKGDGIDHMIEMLALQSEVLELAANPKAPPRGRVIEGRKDPNRGVIATLIVEEGTLRRGDAVVAGMSMGRVRTMLDDRGRTVKEAPPSTPVEVFGLDEVPESGDPFHVVADERLARDAVDERRAQLRQSTVVARELPSLENLFAKAPTADAKDDTAAGTKELRVILKADVRGSLEPLKNEIEKLQHSEVKINMLYSGLGAVTKSDVDNAIAAGAVILGFHVLSEPDARKEAERAGVEIRHYMVIYELIDELRAAMERRLAPERREQVNGHAQVRAVFQSSKFGSIAGCYVLDGVVRRADFVRIYRDGRLIYGQDRPIQIDSLRRIKDDVREVREGFECGIRITQYQDVRPNDVLEFFEMREVKRTLAP